METIDIRIRHDGVRVKFNNIDPLNKSNLTFNEYLVLRRETEEWFHSNGR